MGWTGMYEEARGKSNLDAAIMSEGLNRADIVTSNTSGSAVYLALRVKSGEVFCLVCIVERKNGETFVKGMDEGMGPYYFAASARTLAALSPTTNEEANKWRAACRERAQRKAALKPGCDVKTARDLNFGRFGTLPAGTLGKIVRVAGETLVLDTTYMGRVRVRHSAVEVQS